jgi:membrane fusion protein, heavy metal efflux system
MKNLLIISLLLLGLAACSEKPEKEKKEKKDVLELTKENLQYIKIEEVQPMSDSDDFSVVGEVSFAEDNVVRVYPIVSGSVEKVYVSLGDYVQRGQLLATLLSTDISSYQRDHNVAKNNLAVSEKNLERAKELYRTKVISEKDLAEAQRDFTNANYEYNEKLQILQLYGGSTQKTDATYNIIAPNSGYIVERNINQGTQIRTDNNTNVFTISDLRTVWVWANVYESDLSKVHVGDDVSVKTIAYPDKIFDGTIKKINTMLDPASRVIKVRTELNNSEGLLKPEMFATVIISPKTDKSVLAVPNTSIVIENNKFWVMKEVEQNKFKKVEVQTGKTIKNYIQINSGIQVGDKIVVDGALFLQTAYNKL